MAHERSRLRFAEYRKQFRENRRNGKKPDRDQRRAAPAQPRSFWRLLIEFWGMLAGHRPAVVFALATVTVSTLLSLVPPASTKLMIDYVLTDKPLEPPWSSLIPEPASRLQLLWWLAGGVLAISVAETLIRLWGRWY